nr:immunoglobulin heavy chain junction region [Mus musculus]
CARNSWFAYW